MSSPERRRQKKREWEAEQERREVEQRRLNALPWTERISEADSVSELQEILQRLVEHLGIEWDAFKP